MALESPSIEVATKPGMWQPIPTKIFLTKGVGRHREKLASFELALRDASIAEFNIVKVSSIFPPYCKVAPKEEVRPLLRAGQVLHVVMSQSETNEPHRLIAASVGLAIPKDPEKFGYLSEHHSHGETAEKAGDYCEDLAAIMLATTLGVDFDPDASYDEKKEVWKISDQFVRTTEITQSAIGDVNGQWTTVVAAAVLYIPGPNGNGA